MPSPMMITALTFVALCALMDVRERRIPNVLSGAALLGGMLMNLLYGGTAGALTSLAGVAVGAGLLLGPFALGGVGAGDVKMMGAVGAVLGPRLTLLGGLFGMAFGGALMAVHLLRLGRLAEVNAHLALMARDAVATRSTAPLRMSAESPGAVTLPYSVPLGIGTLLAMVVAG